MKRTKEEKWILWGIPALFLMGALFHFLYELTGRLFPVGLIAPVNESVFEHMKMPLVPGLLWWSIYYLAKRNNSDIDGKRWFTAALIAISVAILTIPLLFYFYTGAFGIESMIVDILILLVAWSAGQTLGLHYYKHGKGLPISVSLFLLLAILVLFVLGTLIPPYLPIFRDALTGSYGIYQK